MERETQPHAPSHYNFWNNGERHKAFKPDDIPGTTEWPEVKEPLVRRTPTRHPQVHQTHFTIQSNGDQET